MTEKLRVLIVDDHADTAQQLESLVASWNHVPRIALTGARALEIAAEFRPTVVLVDLNLPDQHGYEVARQLRERADGPITFVAITGWSQIADQLLSTAAGISHHLVKPVNATVLREILDGCQPAETVETREVEGS